MDFGSLGAGAAGGAVVGIVIRASDEFSSTFEKATKDMSSLQGFSVGLTGSMLALGAGVGVVAGALANMAIKATEAGDVQESFNQLAGGDGTAALEKMNAATLDTISNVDLMKMANDAFIKGMKSEDLPTLALYSQQLADMGKGNVAGNMETITQALATGRTAQLKGLGIQIDENEAYKKYAESIGIVNNAKGEELKLEEASIQQKIDYYEKIGGSSRMLSQLKTQLKAVQEEEKKNLTSSSDFSSVLDESQKKAAMHTEILAGVAEASAKLPQPTKDAADAVAGLSKNWADAQIQIGNALAPMVEEIATKLMPMFQSMADFFMTNILPAFELLFTSVSGLMDEFGGSNESVSVFIQGIGYAIEGVVVFFALVIKGIQTILQWANVITQWGLVIKDVIVDKVVSYFKLLGDVWDMMKNSFKLGALEIKFVFQSMANAIIDSFQKTGNTIVGWINKIIDVYNSMASTLGFKQKSHFENLDFSGMKYDTSNTESQIRSLGTELAGNVNNVNIDIQNITGVDPEDMAKALRKQLNDLVST